MHSAEIQLLGVSFRKGEVGDRRLHWLETIPAMSVCLLFKKRTTKADCMSGHILALRVICFKTAMEKHLGNKNVKKNGKRIRYSLFPRVALG